MDSASAEDAHADWCGVTIGALRIGNPKNFLRFGEHLVAAADFFFTGFVIGEDPFAQIAVVDEYLADLRARVDKNLLAWRGLPEFRRNLGYCLLYTSPSPRD